MAPKTGEKRGDVDVGVRLVGHRDVDGDIRPQNLPLCAIRGNASASEFEGIIARHQRITYPSSS
jgi:hypothetical protein